MIIVRLRGGLGNQLFQCAAAFSLAAHHRVELKSDLYTYQKHPLRKYELHHFNITIPEASREEVHRFTGSNFIVRYLNKKNNYFNCPEVFAQPHYHFYEDFFSLPSSIYLSGYWQSEKYFTNVASDLRKMITPLEPLDQKNTDLINTIRSCDSVAVHIRRADYTKSGFFSTLDMSYYRRAFEAIQKKIDNPRYFIFSDDIAWSRQELSDLDGATFVDHNKGNDSFKDLVVMSACKNQVIANSTFSWWAAWLNDNPGKMVIAPQTWFRDPWVSKKEPTYPVRFYNTRDLIPTGWTRL